MLYRQVRQFSTTSIFVESLAHATASTVSKAPNETTTSGHHSALVRIYFLARSHFPPDFYKFLSPVIPTLLANHSSKKFTNSRTFADRCLRVGKRRKR